MVLISARVCGSRNVRSWDVTVCGCDSTLAAGAAGAGDGTEVAADPGAPIGAAGGAAADGGAAPDGEAVRVAEVSATGAPKAGAAPPNSPDDGLNLGRVVKAMFRREASRPMKGSRSSSPARRRRLCRPRICPATCARDSASNARRRAWSSRRSALATSSTGPSPGPAAGDAAKSAAPVAGLPSPRSRRKAASAWVNRRARVSASAMRWRNR